MLKEGDYSLQVCDQCHNKRIKCDRELPQCHQCHQKNIKCTYLRVLKQSKQLYPDRVSILPLGRLPNQPTRKRRSKKEIMEIRLKEELKKKEQLIVSRSKKASKPPPTPSYIGPQPIAYYNGISHIISNTDHVQLLTQAVNCYFQNVNSAFPLFLTEFFLQRDRSNLLMTIVYLTGLSLISKQNSQVNILISHYRDIIPKLIQGEKLMRLDTVQAILIDNYTKLQFLPSGFKNLLNSIVNGLGLFHPRMPYWKLRTSILIERNMCYSAFLQLSTLHHIHINTDLIPYQRFLTQLSPVNSIRDMVVLKDQCSWLINKLWFRLISALSEEEQHISKFRKQLSHINSKFDKLKSKIHSSLIKKLGPIVDYYKIMCSRITLRVMLNFIAEYTHEPDAKVILREFRIAQELTQFPVNPSITPNNYYEMCFYFQLFTLIMKHIEHINYLEKNKSSTLSVLKRILNEMELLYQGIRTDHLLPHAKKALNIAKTALENVNKIENGH